MALGYASPMRMLREMSSREWLEWQVFLQLERPESERADWRAASIVRTLRELHRNPEKQPKPVQTKDCLIHLGDEPDPNAPTRKRHWKENKDIFFAAMREHARAETNRKAGRR